MAFQVAAQPAKMKWSYGVTTVPRRFDSGPGNEPILPRTLESLAKGGFDKPWLFVDGATSLPPHLSSAVEEKRVTFRAQPIRTHGNWILSIYELYIREPEADRYALFQDDFVTYLNLRQYLEACPYPDKGYWNCYTFNSNHTLAERGGFKRWYESNQMGRGAVALVFNRDVLMTLLSTRYMVERPIDPHRGWRAVDGGIVTALKREGVKEYVHNPSLVQHIGEISSMGNKPHQSAPAWKGESFNALDLLTS